MTEASLKAKRTSVLLKRPSKVRACYNASPLPSFRPCDGKCGMFYLKTTTLVWRRKDYVMDLLIYYQISGRVTGDSLFLFLPNRLVWLFLVPDLNKLIKSIFPIIVFCFSGVWDIIDLSIKEWRKVNGQCNLSFNKVLSCWEFFLSFASKSLVTSSMKILSRRQRWWPWFQRKILQLQPLVHCELWPL